MAEPKPNAALGVEDVVGSYRKPDAVDLLIREGPWLTDVAAAVCMTSVPSRVQLDTLGAVDVETDPVRIGAGRDDEVVLEQAVAAVIHEIDAGIDVDVAHAAIRGRADRRRRVEAEVVDDTRELLVPRSAQPIGADGLQMDGGVRPRGAEPFPWR
jgi:hypothetical protein